MGFAQNGREAGSTANPDCLSCPQSRRSLFLTRPVSNALYPSATTRSRQICNFSSGRLPPQPRPFRLPVLRYRPAPASSTAQNKPTGLMTAPGQKGTLASVRGSVGKQGALLKADPNGAGCKHGRQRHRSAASERSRPGTRRSSFQSPEEPLAPYEIDVFGP